MPVLVAPYFYSNGRPTVALTTSFVLVCIFFLHILSESVMFLDIWFMLIKNFKTLIYIHKADRNANEKANQSFKLNLN